MRKRAYRVMALLLGLGICGKGMAFSQTENYIWSDGSAKGQPAGSCTISWDDTNPFATPHTLMASNDMPDGTVLFSWGYGEFIGGNGITLNCMTSGVHNNHSLIDIDNYTEAQHVYLPYIMSVITYNEQSTISGVRLNMYAQYTTNKIPCPGIDCDGYDGLWLSFSGLTISAYTEISIDLRNTMFLEMATEPVKYATNDYAMAPAYGRFQYRADLIKSGTVNRSQSGEKLILRGIGAHIRQFWNSAHVDQRLFSDPDTNITIVVANCQLKTKDYTIPMGSWGVRPASALPASGSETPINIALKCDDEVPHVRFRFEDTGSSPLGNHNVSLYTAEGGEKVDGMEIEMLYNGAHVDIDNTTLVDTGAHGTAGSTGTDSTAKFTARYVQRSQITRNGNTYVGPVTGKVNMWVTYD